MIFFHFEKKFLAKGIFCHKLHVFKKRKSSFFFRNIAIISYNIKNVFKIVYFHIVDITKSS